MTTSERNPDLVETAWDPITRTVGSLGLHCKIDFRNRQVADSALHPGGVGTVATVRLFTDCPARLTRYVEFVKRVVPMHDDLFDFFYQALPGYEEVGRRRVPLGCRGGFQDPEDRDFTYRNSGTSPPWTTARSRCSCSSAAWCSPGRGTASR